MTRTLVLLSLLTVPVFANAALPWFQSDSTEITDHRAAWEAALRAKRAAQIERLRQFEQAGVYPVNTTIPGYGHQLLDASGNPCAVAYLIIQDGHADWIQQAAAKDNGLVFAAQTKGHFADWIATSGLLREEIAIIQEPGFMELPGDWNAHIVEQQRISAHLQAMVALLEADTDRAIYEALERLGDEIDQAPPAV